MQIFFSRDTNIRRFLSNKAWFLEIGLSFHRNDEKFVTHLFFWKERRISFLLCLLLCFEKCAFYCNLASALHRLNGASRTWCTMYVHTLVAPVCVMYTFADVVSTYMRFYEIYTEFFLIDKNNKKPIIV